MSVGLPEQQIRCCRAGLVQRFSLGFRGPICLFAGFLGVKPSVFGAGVAIGAFGTMALQITAVRLPEPCIACAVPALSACQAADDNRMCPILHHDGHVAVQGYFLRHTNAYLAALALVTGPNALGHVVGPVLTALGMWRASKDRGRGSDRPADAASS